MGLASACCAIEGGGPTGISGIHFHAQGSAFVRHPSDHNRSHDLASAHHLYPQPPTPTGRSGRAAGRAAPAKSSSKGGSGGNRSSKPPTKQRSSKRSAARGISYAEDAGGCLLRCALPSYPRRVGH